MRRDGEHRPVSFDEALAFAAERLGAAAAAKKVGVIGGGRLSDEEAFALQTFAREVLSTNNIDYRTHIQRFASPARFGASLTDLDDADLVLVFGTFTPEQAPVLDLRLRRAVARRGAKLMHIGPYKPDYPVSVQHVEYPPGAIAELMEQLADTVHHGREESGDGFVADIAQQLVDAEKIVAIHNGRNVAGAASLERLMETLARYDHQVGILVVGAMGNARGAEAAGCVPNLGPGYSQVQGAPGLTTTQMLAAASKGELDALVIVGANPALTGADGTLARAAFERVPFLMAVDLFMTETASHADVVFPAAAFAEKQGHTTNLEGRRQAFAQAVEPPVGIYTDSQILASLATALGRPNAVRAEADELYVDLLAAESSAAASRAKDASLP
ncbi:MAG TPA: molybdopterin-dependent oxidoreductase, partial [Caldimonas sp.]|nr:molybdopterin-dependent oxidoreductase [Caldimonas sp.]